jgi:inosine/xanthosine triphosphate pyrophosphatase family protein
MTYNTIYFCTSNLGKFNEVKRILEPQFTVVQIKLELDELQSTDTEYVCRNKITHAVAQINDDIGGHSTAESQLLVHPEGVRLMDSRSSVGVYDKSAPHGIETNYVLLVEDTGLEIANMNGFPGALVKYYLDYLTPEGICKFNGGSNASMHVTIVAYLSVTKALWSHTHKVPGLITDRPKGVPWGADLSYTPTLLRESINRTPSGCTSNWDSAVQGFGFDSVFECTQHPDNLTLAQMMPNVKEEYSARSECAIKLKEFLLS